MATTPAEDLFPNIRNPEGTLVINHRCLIKSQHDQCVVIVGGVVIAQYQSEDRMAEAYAIVNLVEQGWADQNDVARAFLRSVRTVRRYQERFAKGGLAALGQCCGYPKGRRRLLRERTGLIHRWKSEGTSNREIARRLGVSEMAIRKLLPRMGWIEPTAQTELFSPTKAPGANPKLSAFCVASEWAPPVTQDADPADRCGDRLLAYLGLLEDAPPLFGSAKDLSRAGVLLAVPALMATGIFDCAQKIYGSLGPAFYGLRTSLLTLLLMALWRIKRPEGLKEYSPRDLGRVLGLDRAPEVKTLRRKLARLAAVGRAAQFGTALA